ncbi:MAG: BatD family protein [Bdellovibrionales bacterium]
MKKLGSLFFFVNLLFSSLAFGSLKVESSLSDHHLEIGDQVTYRITVISDEKLVRPGKQFSPPEIKGLDYMGVSESSSTGISITNSKRTASYKIIISINYACMREGNFKIPSVDLDLPGGLRTKSINLKVYKKLPANLKKSQSSTAGRRRNRIDSLLDQFMGRTTVQPGTQQRGDFNPEFFTEVEIDKNEVFKGEQVIATWYVYLSANTSLGSFDTLEFPTLRGFWKEDVNFATRFYWKPVLRNGKRYVRSVLSSYALTPYNAGVLNVDSFTLRAVVSQQSFFNRQRKVLKAVSTPLSITVKDLPKPVPASYFGGVGRFKVDSGRSSQKREVLFAEPFIYRIRVIGDKANTKFIKPLKIDTGKEFEVYNIEEEYKFIPQKVSSYKDFKYTIVPKKEGTYRLPEVKVSFLNAETGEYYDSYVKLPVFKVLPNKNADKIKDADFAEDVESTEGDLETAFTFKKGVSYVDYIYVGIPYSLQVIFLLLTLGFCFFLYKRISKVEVGEESLIKNLEERTHKAAATFKAGKRKEALDELINVYSLLIGGVSGKRFGVEEAFNKATENLPPSLKSDSEDLKKLNETLQELRFGSVLESKENQVKLQECLEQFTKLFSEVRDYLR